MNILINLNKYILSHLSDSIKSDDLCDALYISKSALFSKIKNVFSKSKDEEVKKYDSGLEKIWPRCFNLKRCIIYIMDQI